MYPTHISKHSEPSLSSTCAAAQSWNRRLHDPTVDLCEGRHHFVYLIFFQVQPKLPQEISAWSRLTPGPRNNGHPFSFTLLRSPIERFPTLIGCYNINAIPVHFHFQLRILWRPRDLFRRMGTRDRHRASFPSSCGKPLAPPEALIFWAIAVVGIVIAELPLRQLRWRPDPRRCPLTATVEAPVVLEFFVFMPRL